MTRIRKIPGTWLTTDDVETNKDDPEKGILVGPQPEEEPKETEETEELEVEGAEPKIRKTPVKRIVGK